MGVVVGQNHRPLLHLADFRRTLENVEKMTVLLPDGRAGLVGRPFVDFSSETVQAVVLELGGLGGTSTPRSRPSASPAHQTTIKWW